jgi:hypothetical protein
LAAAIALRSRFKRQRKLFHGFVIAEEQPSRKKADAGTFVD